MDGGSVADGDTNSECGLVIDKQGVTPLYAMLLPLEMSAGV